MISDKQPAFQAQLDQASRALEAGDYKACHEHCIAAIKLDPRHPEPFFLLSVLTSDHLNFAKALEIVERGIAAGGGDARFLAQRAKCLALLNRHAEAAEQADAAVEASPKDVFSLETLGVVFSRIGEHVKAVPLFQQASKLASGNAEMLYNLGASLQFSGEFDAARDAYQAAILIKPDHHKAHYGVASLHNQSGETQRLEQLKVLFEACDAADEALHLGHAIAKTLEDMGEHEEAMEYLLQAKSRKRSELGYDFSKDAALFEAAEDLVDFEIPAHSAAQRGKGPIFIVGMPRTGTSLVDRILSSHSQVISMGELAYFGLFLKHASGTPSPLVLDADTLAAASRIDLAEVGQSYLDATTRLRSDAANFIDKMPLNVFYAPLLLAAFPDARVVCLKRSAMDTCVSNFRQLFSTSYSYYNYSYDLEDTGRFYLGFDRLVDRWCEALPAERFTTVQYEEVVADQEGETRRLLDFCGLDFEAQCIDFHSNPAPIATASSVQVRKPIYATSVDRWKKFGSAIAPLEVLMREAEKI